MEDNPVLTAEIIDSNHDNSSVISGNKNNTSTSDTYYDYSYKIIIIGNSGTGKSSLIKSAVSNEFNNNYQTTIAFEYSSMTIKVNNDKTYKLQIWDTCGQEIYRSLISNFYRNASLAVLLYSINDTKSFEALDEWVNDLREKASSDILIFLVGNKSDLEEERVISFEQGKQYSNAKNLNFFAETSAKNRNNAKGIFLEAAKQLHLASIGKSNNASMSGYENNEIGNNSILKETLEQNKKNKKKCC